MPARRWPARMPCCCWPRPSTVIAAGEALAHTALLPATTRAAAVFMRRVRAADRIEHCLRLDGGCPPIAAELTQERSDARAAALGRLAMGRRDAARTRAAQVEPQPGEACVRRCRHAGAVGARGVGGARAVAVRRSRVRAGTTATRCHGASPRALCWCWPARPALLLLASALRRRRPLAPPQAMSSRLGYPRPGVGDRAGLAALAGPVGQRPRGKPLSRAVSPGASVAGHADLDRRAVPAPAARAHARLDAVDERRDRARCAATTRLWAYVGHAGPGDAGRARSHRHRAVQHAPAHVGVGTRVVDRRRRVVLLPARRPIGRTPVALGRHRGFGRCATCGRCCSSCRC